MGQRNYSHRSEFDVSADELFRWHARPGAFARLVPPWEDVRLVGPAARIAVGSTQDLSVPVGPLRTTWRSEITSVTEGREFIDTQVSGPFRSWVHTHAIEPGSSSTDAATPPAVLEDRVRYALPFGPLGELVAGGFTRRKLERMFAYRHRITAQDMARHDSYSGEPLDVLVSGASGLVGQALCAFLTTGGHRARKLVRRKPRNADEFHWDPAAGTIDPACAEGASAVVHLAGENIAARRWSPIQRQRLRRSRVEGTRLVANAVRAAQRKPSVFVAASAVGFYGDRDDEELNETSARGSGFLADLCDAWEAESRWLTGLRAVQLRFGVVVSPAGGALAKMLLPFRLGLGGRIGHGRQWMSWIALDDALGVIWHALSSDALSGPVNAVAPAPATNAEYTRTLGRVLGRPTIFPVPAVAARAAFGEMADQLLLASQRALPTALQASGYRFDYPDLEGALRHQLGRDRSA